MIYTELAKMNLAQAPEIYNYFVEYAIRQRYSVSAELAILRQRDTKPEEFNAYNAYCERCKREVKEALGM